MRTIPASSAFWRGTILYINTTVTTDSVHHSTGMMLPKRLTVFAAISALSTLGSPVYAREYETRFPGTSWNDEDWIITTTNLDQGHYQSRGSLANGYLGINLAAVGPFFEVDTPVNGDQINGWPLFDRRQTFATIGGFYDSQPITNGTNFDWLNQYGGESVISGVPHWSGLHVQSGDDVLDASVPADQISDFKSTLNVHNAEMNWSYTWTPSSGSAIGVEYSMFVHKLHVNQAAVQLRLTADEDTEVSVIDVLNGDAALRTDSVDKAYDEVLPMIWTAVLLNGFSDIYAYIYSAVVGDDSCHSGNRTEVTNTEIIGANSSSIAQAFPVSLRAGQTSTLHKYVGAASSDAFEDPQNTALKAAYTASQEGFAMLLQSHSEEWHSIMTPDSVDDYRFPENGTLPDDANVIELAITAVTNAFQLLQNTIGANAIEAAGGNDKLAVNSISVGGLYSDSYAGFIFWDAEVWMAPGLVVAFPQAARQIAQYRVEKYAQAQENINTAYQSSQNQTDKFSPSGAVFPWTSARFGNCTGTGPCYDYEYHINGDIGLEFYNYWTVSGDTPYFKNELFPIHDAVAQLFADVVTYNETTDQYDLYNATDPDEYANFQTNVGFTMVLMKTHLQMANSLRERFGMRANASWAEIADKITVPVNEDAGIILEYQAMNGSIEVKQADIVLIDDFLDYPNEYTLADLDYYAAKQSPDGPAMTYGVFSIVANEASPSGCSSYTYDLYGSAPYTRGPWFQFSEQLIDDWKANGGTHPAYPFLTGVGGANRVAVFGYLGLRLMVDSLNVNPSLPPQIPYLSYRTIYWQGWPVNATSNQTHTTLSRGDLEPLETANMTFADSAIPITIGIDSDAPSHSLEPNGTVVLENRRIGEIKTVPGNIAQCRPVQSGQDIVPGQFALAAVDGAASTRWQVSGFITLQVNEPALTIQQPAQSNITSSLTVALSEPFVQVTALEFDWAQAPPVSYSVTFSNSSDNADPVAVTSSDNVEVSDPYDAANAYQIVAPKGNTTNVTLDAPVWSGRYATLSIRGNQNLVGTPDERNGTGASVAEFSIVAENTVGNDEDLRSLQRRSRRLDVGRAP